MLYVFQTCLSIISLLNHHHSFDFIWANLLNSICCPVLSAFKHNEHVCFFSIFINLSLVFGYFSPFTLFVRISSSLSLQGSQNWHALWGFKFTVCILYSVHTIKRWLHTWRNSLGTLESCRGWPMFHKALKGKEA